MPDDLSVTRPHDARMADMAARFGVRPPKIKYRSVPSWQPEGVMVFFSGRRSKVWIDPRFDDLPPPVQEAELAYVAAMIALRKGIVLQTAVFGVLAAIGTLHVLVSLLGRGLPFLLGLLLAYVIFLPVTLVVSALNIYRVDRLVAKVCGLSTVSADLDYVSDNPPGIVLRMLGPGPARRAARLGLDRSREDLGG
ncbi:hypothetical protein DPM19_13795 [Actinomadura craniellae]|uniref:Uncharacterized protein n=1 Tax=Actinomadura craniellae TaxID=2231787 RepID=A0A365H6Q0_9ACTN|nr:hypothetical protein [Actinomadura craniellae]RAY14800.1 hypothetical protein DPM19_13795 [Actinomadura craniellae]